MEREKWQKAAESFIEKWQAILHLRDWRITVEFNDELPESTDEHEFACIFHCFTMHNAFIHVLNPDIWTERNKYWRSYSLESVLVHELLHLHFTRITHESELHAEDMELAINQLTDAFLGLERKISNE